ncbi:MAG TPA: RNA polymerase sigma factor [Candidatus Paceibacterota bacterium]|nr:RNA polymerase sigma factor [Candidatus Paceibacterota bacterium]
MDGETDEAIALRVQAGDGDAFGTLIERYQAKLMRYARKFLLDPDDATDIVQDIFIKSYQNIQSFDASRRFSPWVYRIAHNEFVNALKKRISRRTVFTIDFDTLFPHLVAPDTSDSAAMERDTRAALDQYLDQVGPKYREPLVLYYLEGMDYKEISEILQIPVSTVGVRLARGRAALQKIAAAQPLYE